MLSSWTHFLHSTVELYLSGLIGTASHPDVQKIRIVGFFLRGGGIGYLVSFFKFGCFYSYLLVQYVPASKPFNHV